MKKSEIKQLIKEEIYKILRENQSIGGYTDGGRGDIKAKYLGEMDVPYGDADIMLNSPSASAYSQVAGGRKIKTWEELIAVLNSFDVDAAMSDDPRTLDKMRKVRQVVKDFVGSYSGEKDWSGLNKTGEIALDDLKFKFGNIF